MTTRSHTVHPPSPSPRKPERGPGGEAERAPRYIEKSFPIVQLNPLSVRERNAFKPIYKMHKWFARRSSSIFRAILLASALPHEDEHGRPLDLMEEFYKGHRDDPRLKHSDGSPLKVLDPFMGGGTTVVEALRLGFDVTGVDSNPVAWFIVKGMTTPVDVDALRAAFDRVAAKVREKLLDLYRTRCPVTGDAADIIYAFWVKQGICVDPGCRKATDLFKSYEVARKRGDATLKYLEVVCPSCSAEFDWELDRCTVTAGGPQIEGPGAAGKGRPADRKHVFALWRNGAACPDCGKGISFEEAKQRASEKTKKVELHVLVDPSTGDFFEVRGEIPRTVTAPASGHTFEPEKGPAEEGKFTCVHCGRKQTIVESAESHGKPLPFRYYGFYAHTPHANRDHEAKGSAEKLGLPTNNDKWFARVTAADLENISRAEAELARIRHSLPLPDQELYDGYNTNRLVIHKYHRWTDLFGSRQQLALGLLLRAIADEKEPTSRDALLGAFQSHLDNTSFLTGYQLGRNQLRNVTAGHDYRNPTSIAENNIWGIGQGQGTFGNCWDKYLEGIDYQRTPTLKNVDGDVIQVSETPVSLWMPDVTFSQATDLQFGNSAFDLVITDPPYSGSVQYAEMSDFFYVWLHKVLKDEHPEFEPEITLKSQEIIEDGRDKTPEWYFERLTEAWRECHRVLRDDGLLVFTFHHREGDRWSGLLKSLFDAGFVLVAAYPTHSEALNSIVIQATGGITYDIIHVCRKRPAEVEPIAWSLLRKQVQQAARQQLKEIEGSTDVLPGPDVWMILLGSALQLFSRHYGQVIDADGSALDLDEAMSRIQGLVREVRGESLPLPGVLEDADGLSRVYLLHVAGHTAGWTHDGLHIELRGYRHSTDDLLEAGLIRKAPRDRKRWEAVPVLERFESRQAEWRRGGPVPRLVDRLHYVLGLARAGEDLAPALRRFERGLKPAQRKETRALLVEGLKYLAKLHRDDAAVRDLCGLVERFVERFATTEGASDIKQGDFFAAFDPEAR